LLCPHHCASMAVSNRQHWGGFTTFKPNAPELLGKSLLAGQIIYCSPLVAEAR
jgi:hypothetical protein